MHPRSAALIAFSDAEADAGRSRAIAGHLRKCEQCRTELQRIQGEKDNFSNFEGTASVMEIERGLAALLSAVAAWKEARISGVAPEVRSRVHEQMEVYFGSEVASLIDRPGIRADELLAKALELADAFLGCNAADAVRNHVLRGLHCVESNTEICR